MSTKTALIIGALVALPLAISCSDDDGETPDSGTNVEAGVDAGDGPAPGDSTPDAPVAIKTCQTTCEKIEDCGNNGQGYVACELGKCIQCKEDTDCADPYKGCTAGRCVFCKDNTHCTTGLQTCNASFGICDVCNSDADCNSGAKIASGKCDQGRHQCTRCDNDDDCTYSGAPGKYCVQQHCVACKSDADCTAGSNNTGKCDTLKNHACLKCDSDEECTTAFTIGKYTCRAI